jgi:hypothetical protein
MAAPFPSMPCSLRVGGDGWLKGDGAMLHHRLRGRARGLSLTAGAGALALGLYVAITTWIGVALNYSPVPVADQWDGYIANYVAFQKLPWMALWLPHNEHRHLLARLVFFPDMAWFGGLDLLSLAVDLLLCLLFVALSLRILQRGAERESAATRLFLAGVVLACGFSWVQCDNFTRGFQLPFFAVCLFGLGSFHALAVCRQRGGSTAWLAVSVASGIAAAFSMANGLLILPLCGLFACLLRLPWRHAATLAVAAGLTWAVYFFPIPGMPGPIAQEAPLAVAARDPVGAAAFALLYLGSPVSYVLRSDGTWQRALETGVGLLVVAGLLAGFALVLRREARSRVPQLWMMAVSAGFSAALAAAGRAPFGLREALTSRYTTQALAAWAALMVFFVLNLSGGARRALLVLSGVVLVALGVAQGQALRPDQRELVVERIAGLALRNAVYDDRYIGPLYRRPARLVEVAKQAQPQGLSIFGRGVPGFDDPPARPIAEGTCLGRIETARPTATPGKIVVEGWGWDAEHAALPQGIAITGPDGRTIGSGLFGKIRHDIEHRLGVREKRTGWIAFADATPGPIRVLAKTAPGRYCAIGEIPVPHGA